MWLHLGGCTEGDPVGPPGGGKARSEGWEQPWDTLSCGFRLAASPGPSPRCWHSRLLSYQTTHTPWQTGRASRTGAGIWCHLAGLLLRASELLCRLSSLQLALPVPAAEPLPAEDVASLLFGPEAVLPARPGAPAAKPGRRVCVIPGQVGVVRILPQWMLVRPRVLIPVLCRQEIRRPSESSGWSTHWASPCCLATVPGVPGGAGRAR